MWSNIVQCSGISPGDIAYTRMRIYVNSDVFKALTSIDRTEHCGDGDGDNETLNAKSISNERYDDSGYKLPRRQRMRSCCRCQLNSAENKAPRFMHSLDLSRACEVFCNTGVRALLTHMSGGGGQ